ncbi:MAG: CAP domain-containing protein [Leptospira sp.]|nr:CAP domain-containing protein [Leptospira sp.]
MKKFSLLLISNLIFVSAVSALDLARIEKLIFDQTNKERTSRSLPAYLPNSSLESIARIHSANMIKFNFFSHKDNEGLGPGGRMQKYHPDVLGGVGENIAYNFGKTEEAVATNLMTAWMKSPGHRKNILSGAYSHLGVGIVESKGRFYGTQNFGTLTSELTSKKKGAYSFDEKLDLEFQYLGTKPRDKLTIFIELKNRSAHYKMPNGSFYTGVAKVDPIRMEENRFTLSFVPKESYGTGLYKIRMGYSGSFYPESIDFQVVKKTEESIDTFINPNP